MDYEADRVIDVACVVRDIVGHVVMSYVGKAGNRILLVVECSLCGEGRRATCRAVVDVVGYEFAIFCRCLETAYASLGGSSELIAVDGTSPIVITAMPRSGYFTIGGHLQTDVSGVGIMQDATTQAIGMPGIAFTYGGYECDQTELRRLIDWFQEVLAVSNVDADPPDIFS